MAGGGRQSSLSRQGVGGGAKRAAEQSCHPGSYGDDIQEKVTHCCANNIGLDSSEK